MKKILVLIILLGLGITAYFGLSKRFYQGPKDVEVCRVKKDRVETFILGTGKIKPLKETIIRAEQEARIKRVLVKEGDRVKPNQVLVEFDREEEKFRLSSAKNKLRMTEIELKEAVSIFKRSKMLYEASATSGLELDEAQTRYDKAVVERNDAQDMVKLAKMRLDRLRCVSPYKGIVVETKIEDGQMVGRGQELFVIVDLSHLQVEADVDEIDIISVTCSQKAVITHEALPDKEFTGEVVEIAPKAKEIPPATVVKVTIRLKEKNPLFKIGMQVDVKIISGYKDGLFLPLRAVREDKEGMFVFIVKNDIACKKRIKTGISSLDKVEVLGLKENGEVIISHNIREGDRVIR